MLILEQGDARMADWDMLLKMMADPALKQSRQEVEALLDAELDKSEGEMDADLVKEYVLTLMEMDGKTETPLTVTAAPVPKKTAKLAKKRGKWYRACRYGLLAAAVCVLMLLVVSATKQFIQPHIKGVTFYSDRVEVDFSQLEKTALTAKPGLKPGYMLESFGMRNMLLPAGLNDGYTAKVTDHSTEERQSMLAEIQLNQQTIMVNAERVKTGPPLLSYYTFSGENIRVDSELIGELRVVYLQEDDYTQILYRNDETEYVITLNGGMGAARKLAATLEEAIQAAA